MLSPETERGQNVIWGSTPLSALELPEIPSELHFVRNHFPVPDIDPAEWNLRIDGAAERLLLDLGSLRSLPRRTVSVVLECAGHRRTELDPVPPGVPWACGAVAEAPCTAWAFQSSDAIPGTGNAAASSSTSARI